MDSTRQWFVTVLAVGILSGMASHHPETNRLPGTVSIHTRIATNPHRSPSSDESESAFFALDNRKLSLGELWRSAWPHPLGIALLTIAKMLRWRLKVTGASAPGLARIIDVGEVPQRVLASMQDLLAQCAAEELLPRFAATVPSIGDMESYTLVHPTLDRAALVQVGYTKSGPATQSYISVISKLTEGGIVATSSSTAQPTLNRPPFLLPQRHPGAPLSELLTRHAQRLVEVPGVRAVLLDDLAQRQFVLDLSLWTLEHYRKQGILRPLSRAEAQRLQAQSEGG